MTQKAKKRNITDNDTTNGNSPQKLLINRIVPVIVSLVEPPIVDGVAAGRGTAHARQTIALKVIVPNAARSGAQVFQDPTAVNRKDTDGTIPRDGNTSRIPTRLTSPVLIGGGTNISPTRTSIQDIITPKGPTGVLSSKDRNSVHKSVY